MRIRALFPVLTIAFVCTAAQAADVPVKATDPTVIEALSWAREMSFQAGNWKATQVFCKTVVSEPLEAEPPVEDTWRGAH